LKLEVFLRDNVRGTAEVEAIDAIAVQLRAALELEPCCSHFREMNRPSVSSKKVQAILLPAATSLGFTPERRGLFEGGIAGLTPDYFLRVGETGILLEVERGKTITNNMDLLDFWKCHICEKAHYLFLFAPLALQHNDNEKPGAVFESVRRRLAAFFVPRNYTNVRGLFLFGY
jgi:hypothetical protein